MSDPIKALHEACRAEAMRAPFPVETAVYEAAGRDPMMPILFGGRLDTPLCFFARDLGKDEVMAGEPLKGAAGRLVRSGIYRRCGGTGNPTDAELAPYAQKVLLTNTVPYKPPGNKAYTQEVKKRFRPFLLELLVDHFRGDVIITLGNEAYSWFADSEPGAKAQVDAFWKREDRFEQTLQVTLRSGSATKKVTLAPLPHPSPLNQTYYKQFPALLDARLARLKIDLR